MSAAPISRPERQSLPILLTSFVGREREVAAVAALLRREDVRLLTLIGPGGVGKTRLAIEAARQLDGDFPGGIVFVDLAPVLDSALVLAAVAQEAGVRDVGDQPLGQRLAAILGNSASLLILDNFEHLLSAAPLVTDLLHASPSLTILVTSRARLRQPAERIVAVAPLALPDDGDGGSDVGRAEAIQLFVARAQQVKPSFALTKENADTIAQLCRHLDGLPLAIELAAARSDLLPLPTMLARIDQRLSLLTAGPRDQPARLQTMRAAIGWSYDQLTEDEQSLFRRLSVFTGGCPLGAAQSVWDRPETDVLPVLRLLADKSLLRLLPASDGEPRVVMLETVRAFGLEQLGNHGEESEARRRHAAWCAAFAARAEAALYGPEQGPWTERLEADLANLSAALDWLATHDSPEAALRVANSLFIFWFLRGRLREGAERLTRLLAAGVNATPEERIWALFSTGFLVWAQGDFREAEVLAERGLALAREHDLVYGEALCLFLLHDALKHQGRRDESLVVGEEAIARMRESGNRTWLAHLLGDVGTGLWAAGDRERASALIDESLAIHGALGNKLGAGNKLSDLALLAHDAGDRVIAATRYAEALNLLWESGDRWYLASPVAGLAAIAGEGGWAARAARLIGAAGALLERSGGSVWPDERERYEQTIASARAALGEERYAQEFDAGRALPLPAVIAEATAVADDAQQARRPPRPASPAAAAGLSPREEQVLRLLAAGKTNPEIADALFIGPGTVRTHVQNILAKLDARTRTEAATIAHRRGLV